MSENQAAVLHSPGVVRLEERPRPEPGPLEALVEIRSVTICGSDIHYYEHGRIGDFVVNSPLVLGHESSGVVVANGPGAGRHRVGTRVAIEPGIPCGRCRECRHGRYNLCPDVRFLATPPIDGAFTRYLAVHEDFLYPVPDDLSDDAAALAEPVSVAIWANRRAAVQPGDRVLITGAGPIGLLCAAVASSQGASEVVVSDIDQARLERAGRFGATGVSLGGPGDFRADVLLECSGAEVAVRSGIAALEPAGRAVLIGMSPKPDMSLPVATIQNRELRVTGTFRYANTYPAAISMLTSGLVQPDELIGLAFDLEHAEDALVAPRRDPSVLKTVVRVTTG